MPVLQRMAAGAHEQVIYHRDAATGLRAIVAIHSSRLGPALGGVRWHPFESEEAALTDVLRLSSAMTAKAAMAGLPLGGGKAVVIGDPAAKTSDDVRAFGRFVETLGGRYLTTTDVGTTLDDLDVMAEVTRHVVGTSPKSGGSGDTSELTAVTIVSGMRAALRFLFGDDSFEGRRIMVVGVGKVGGRVARTVAEAGAEISLADVRAEAAARLAQEIGATVVPVESAYASPCDILSPNALGGAINAQSIPALRCRAICGGANNQLSQDPDDGDLLAAQGILYLPDYVVNSGGLISAARQVTGFDEAQARALAEHVGDVALQLLQDADRLGTTPARAAAGRVQEILEGASGPGGGTLPK